MRTQLLSTLFVLAFLTIPKWYLQAQVTLGSATPPIKGALLDLKQEDTNDGTANSTKGLLLPRVELNKLKPVNGKLSESIGNTGTWGEVEHTGLIVYNAKNTLDACTGGALEGVYSWDGKEWLPLYAKKGTPPTDEKNTDKYGGANSYIIKPNSSINIPIERAFKIWKEYSTGNNPATGHVLNTADVGGLGNSLPLIAQIIWQDGGAIVSATISGSGEAANLVVNSGSSEGNALVKVLIDGKVLWQWHIWVTNQNMQDSALPYFVNGKIDWYMERFLGANSATSEGLYYQWGRHVPLQKSGTVELIDATTTEKDNLTNAIQSEKFIRFETTKSHDWYSSTPKQWNNRWIEMDGQDVRKSPFDPCPYGWRLPHNETGKSPWECIEKDENTQEIGRNAFSGYRTNGDASLGDVGKAGYVWTANDNGTMAGALYYNTSEIEEWDAFNRANGFNVRCIKEK